MHSGRHLLRIWERVNKTDACWLWTGATQGNDEYGVLWWNGRYQGAHRVIYQILVGELSRETELHHKCETKLCVNPEHLEKTTKLEHPDSAINQKRLRNGKFWQRNAKNTTAN